MFYSHRNTFGLILDEKMSEAFPAGSGKLGYGAACRIYSAGAQKAQTIRSRPDIEPPDFIHF